MKHTTDTTTTLNPYMARMLADRLVADAERLEEYAENAERWDGRWQFGAGLRRQAATKRAAAHDVLVMGGVA